MKMPFGKWKNTEISELPTPYLTWMSEQKMSPEIEKEVQETLHRRKNPEKGVTTRLPEAVFMGELGAVLLKCPEKFLIGKWFITIEGIGRFEFEKVD